MNKIYYLLFELIVVISLISIPFYSINIKEVSSLINYIVVIDPGHGGKDNGCENNGVLEDDINLEIGLKLFEELTTQGFRTYLTRDGDYDLASVNASNRKNEDLRNRVKIINNYDANLVISLHVNYYSSSSIQGPMVYYKNDQESKDLALIIQEKLNQASGLDKIIHKEDFYIFRNTYCPSLLIECGFISNDSDLNRLTNSTYQTIISKKISEGLISYFLYKK